MEMPFIYVLRIKKGERIYDGLEVPSYDPSIVVIKLKNGYNVGFRREEIEIIRIGEGEETQKAGAGVKAEEDPGQKYEVSILGTGGTIASYVDYSTGAVYPARSTSELLRFLPELREVVKARALFSVFSENMGYQQWKRIAQAVKEELDSGARGVVIAHGTDTMCYTASALSFMLPELSGPVIFTGAQRSTDRPSSDGFLNILSSVKLALTDIGEVVIAMHAGPSDDAVAVHRATRARKMHTSARGAFQSSKPLGYVHGNSNDMNINIEGYRKKGEETVIDAGMDEHVALLYFYPSMSSELFESVAEKSSGIVIAGTGLGHVSETLVESIKSCSKPVCMVSQCLNGSVNLNVYATGRKLLAAGVIPCADMLPETAYVKLMWVLGHTHEPEEVKELMQRNIAGEIEDRRICES